MRRLASVGLIGALVLPSSFAGEPRWNVNEMLRPQPAPSTSARPPATSAPRPATTAPASPAAPSAGGTAAPPGKTLSRSETKALVVVDRNCPQLVQPYTLADNASLLAVFGTQEAVSDLLKRAPQALAGLTGSVGATAKPSRPGTPSMSGEVTASMRSAAKQLNWLPMSAEVAYGQKLHEQQTLVLDRDSKLGRQYYPVADQLLKQVLAAVGQPHDYTFHLYILKSAGRNAMALPGGLLYIDQGLVDSPAALPKARFALAHEIAHVLQRHETKELQSLVVDSISSKQDLTRVMTSTRSDPNAILAYVKAEKNRFTQHHVDQELQADACSVRLLARALPDRKDLAESINAFLGDLPPPAPAPKPSTTGGPLAGIVDTPAKRHPTTDERLRNLRSIYNEVAATPAPSAPPR